MNELVYLKNNAAVCDSLQVAEKFGKRHDKVLRAIDDLRDDSPKMGSRPSCLLKAEERRVMGTYTECI